MKAKIKYKMVNADVYRELKETNEKLLDKCIELKAKNEELKKLIKRQSDVLINKIGKADEYQDDYAFMKTENEKYSQALNEIEQYCIDTLELQDVHTIKQDISKYIKAAKGEGKNEI